MTTKVVYFTIGDVEEQAEFSSDTPAEEVKGLRISSLNFVSFEQPTL